MKKIYPLSTIALSLALMGSSFGVTIFDELTDGELSNSGLAPTSVTLMLGANTIIGEIGNNGQTGATDGTDGDFFTFSILDGFVVESFSITRAGANFQSFVGYNDAATITETSVAGLAGGNLFNNNGTLGTANITPIPTSFGAGDHTFVFQEVANQVADFSVTFNLAAIPEPSSAALLALGLLPFTTRRRR